jgi:hypothetical protein
VMEDRRKLLLRIGISKWLRVGPPADEAFHLSVMTDVCCPPGTSIRSSDGAYQQPGD